MSKYKTGIAVAFAVVAMLVLPASRQSVRVLQAQTAAAPTMLVPNLAVRTVFQGATMPTTMAFLGRDDFFLLEKTTGRVLRIVGGQLHSVVLDLPVNFASERGLLGIALHPDFPKNPGVYLYWTCSAPPPPASNPFIPTLSECPDNPGTGADTNDVLAVPLLGNRVDRFVWNGTSLTYDRNLIKLHAFQNDAAPLPAGQGDGGQNAAGNHNGGILRFGPDRKLYIIIGDNGRRGQLQNLAEGPTPPSDDDQFGGPEPDDFHLTGSIFRLNDDGSTPTDNPLYSAGGAIGGDAGDNIQKIFAYGIRNSFGMAFDPISGQLWTQENGDDTFDEINRVEPGMDGGWVQIMGPVARIAEFASLERTLTPPTPPALQQLRWPPDNIADTPQEALSRLVLFPGAHYSDPEFSWKYAVAPAGIGFMNGRGLGPQYDGDLFVGASRPTLAGGYLFRLQLTGNRRKIAVDDARLDDRVADNTAKFDITESESLLVGRDFGVGTDIQTGPNGNLFVVSLSNGAVYEIYRVKGK